MEDYNNAVNFSKKNVQKKDIFLYANNNNNKFSILGLIDGIILRDDNINILNGLIKQNINLLDEEDLILSIEHACLLHQKEHIKTISNFINNNVLYLDIYQYIKKKDLDCVKYIEPFIKKLNIIINEEDDEVYETSQKTIENDINDIKNINIENLNINIDNINIYNIHLPKNVNYFDKITKSNIIDL